MSCVKTVLSLDVSDEVCINTFGALVSVGWLGDEATAFSCLRSLNFSSTCAKCDALVLCFALLCSSFCFLYYVSFAPNKRYLSRERLQLGLSSALKRRKGPLKEVWRNGTRKNSFARAVPNMLQIMTLNNIISRGGRPMYLTSFTNQDFYS